MVDGMLRMYFCRFPLSTAKPNTAPLTMQHCLHLSYMSPLYMSAICTLLLIIDCLLSMVCHVHFMWSPGRAELVSKVKLTWPVMSTQHSLPCLPFTAYMYLAWFLMSTLLMPLVASDGLSGAPQSLSTTHYSHYNSSLHPLYISAFAVC